MGIGAVTVETRGCVMGIGAVTVEAPRVRDRGGQLRVASLILPPFLGAPTRGVLAREAPGLSAGAISRLKAVWQEEHAQ